VATGQCQRGRAKKKGRRASDKQTVVAAYASTHVAEHTRRQTVASRQAQHGAHRRGAADNASCRGSLTSYRQTQTDRTVRETVASTSYATTRGVALFAYWRIFRRAPRQHWRNALTRAYAYVTLRAACALCVLSRSCHYQKTRHSPLLALANSDMPLTTFSQGRGNNAL